MYTALYESEINETLFEIFFFACQLNVSIQYYFYFPRGGLMLFDNLHYHL